MYSLHSLQSVLETESLVNEKKLKIKPEYSTGNAVRVNYSSLPAVELGDIQQSIRWGAFCRRREFQAWRLTARLDVSLREK